jgi:hypothetical protein
MQKAQGREKGETQMTKRRLPPISVQKWIISVSKSSVPGHWHVQARTKDELSSFAAVVPIGTPMSKNKSTSGYDIFTMATADMKTTMNVFGKIEYHFKE